MAQLTVRDVAVILRLMRLDRVEELASCASQFPNFDEAIMALAGQGHESPTERQKGLAAVRLLTSTIRAMAPASNGDNYIAYRAYHLLEAFYLGRQSRHQTLQALGLGGGSFDRLKALALQKFLDALSLRCAQLQGARSPMLDSQSTFGLGESVQIMPKLFIKCQHVPHPPFRLLRGREAEVNDIASQIVDPQGPQVVAISGCAGVGKTALAHAVIRQICESETFVDVLWIKAHSRPFPGSPLFSQTVEPLTVQIVVEQLTAQGGIAHERHLRVDTLLRSQRYLIVIDGLDQSENEIDIILQLLNGLGRSTLLVTTRHRSVEELPVVYPVHLGSLSAKLTKDFVRAEAQRRRLRQLASADDAVLHQIYLVTGGLPLALNLVLAKSSSWSLDKILSELRTASAQFEDFYKFLMYQEWRVLGNAARAFLLHIAATIASHEDVIPIRLAAGDLTANAQYLESIVRVGLLESHEALLASDHYFRMPPLVRNFLLSNLPIKWGRQMAAN